MKCLSSRACLAALLLLLFFLSAFAHADVIKGKVVGVVDGDTITVMLPDGSQSQVRLAGIDAPEKDQVSGMEARAFLTSLVLGKSIRVEFSKRDQYGRIVGKALLNARDINLEMVKAGFAWHYRQHESEQSEEDRRLYAAAEAEAKQVVKGLWSDSSPVPPWDFREQKNQNEQTAGNSPNRPLLPRGSLVIKGRVRAVTSGDTLTLVERNSPVNVCLRYVAAPYPGQPYTDTAKQHLGALTLDRDVIVAVSREDEEKGCFAGEVFRDDLNVGLQMVRDGVAWYDQSDPVPEGDMRWLFEQSELAARGERRGLWLDAAPTPPWVLRERKAAESGGSAGGGYGNGGYSTSPGTVVRVRAYTRSNGTHVRSHTRSAPGRGSGGRSGGDGRGRR